MSARVMQKLALKENAEQKKLNEMYSILHGALTRLAAAATDDFTDYISENNEMNIEDGDKRLKKRNGFCAAVALPEDLCAAVMLLLTQQRNVLSKLIGTVNCDTEKLRILSQQLLSTISLVLEFSIINQQHISEPSWDAELLQAAKQLVVAVGLQPPSLGDDNEKQQASSLCSWLIRDEQQEYYDASLLGKYYGL